MQNITIISGRELIVSIMEEGNGGRPPKEINGQWVFQGDITIEVDAFDEEFVVCWPDSVSSFECDGNMIILGSYSHHPNALMVKQAFDRYNHAKAMVA